VTAGPFRGSVGVGGGQGERKTLREGWDVIVFDSNDDYRHEDHHRHHRSHY
jgi:hypothetical protein